MDEIEIVKTKSDRPAVWVGGGGYTNTGHAYVLASPTGEAMRPLYVRGRGHLASNLQQALMPVVEGCYFISVQRHRDEYKIWIFRFNGEKFEFSAEYLYSSAGWLDEKPPEKLMAAINAAMECARTYHNREPPYVL